MKFPEDMKIKARIEFLERYILVHSYLYYHMNENVISDKKYDRYSRLLVSKIQKYNSKIRSTQYGYVFYDFDGNTGFDLYDRLNVADRKRVKDVATTVLKLYKREIHNA